MIVHINALIELDENEVEPSKEALLGMALLNRHLTSIKLDSVNMRRTDADGFVVSIDRVGLRVELKANKAEGCQAVVELLEKLGKDLKQSP